MAPGGATNESEEGARLIEEPSGQPTAHRHYLRHPLRLALLMSGLACGLVFSFVERGDRERPLGMSAAITRVDADAGEVKGTSAAGGGASAASAAGGASDADAGAPFDCEEDKDEWVLAWSFEKQSYCCQHADKAFCIVPTTTTVLVTTTTKPITTVPTTSKTTEVTTPSPAFDCSAGKANQGMAWSDWKKRWCCTYEKIGCENNQITGTFWVQNLHYDKLIAADKINKAAEEAIKDALGDLVSGKIAGKSGDPSGSSSTPFSNIIRTLAADAANATDATADPKADPKESKVEIDYYKSFSGGVAVHFAITPGEDIAEAEARQRVTCGTIEDPMVKALIAVPDVETVSTTPIAISHCKMDLSKTKVACTCKNGVAVGGSDCPGEGGNICKSCADGFHMIDDKCEANECACYDGIGARGAACVYAGEHVCGFCDAGFHLEQTAERSACIQNVCTCYNGQAATGSKCSQDNSNTCGTCHPGYHLNTENRECEPNECFCENGSPPDLASDKCTEHEAYTCLSCDETYHVNKWTKKCQPNVCTCDGGTAAVGPECKQHNREVCIDCDNPVALISEDGHCGGKTCTCHGGTPVNNVDCTTNRGNQCKSCQVGFEMRHQQCVKSGCNCKGGMPIMNCTKQSESACDTCEEGRHLHDGRCVVNTCNCPHGTPATKDMCLQEQGNVCIGCELGYHSKVVPQGSKHVSITCEPNECSCKKGRAANPTTDPVCRSNLQEYCVSCEAGYLPNAEHKCAKIECKCENGIAKRGLDCRQPGFEDCESCDPDYHKQPGLMIKGSFTCESNKVLEEGAFNCRLGYNLRLLEWSNLKKNFCCEAHAIGCTATVTANQVCLPEIPQAQCKLIGAGLNSGSCCAYNGGGGGGGCAPIDETRVCYKSRTIKLKASIANASLDILTTAENPVESPEQRGMCLQAIAQPGKELTLAQCNEWDARQNWHWEGDRLQRFYQGKTYCAGSASVSANGQVTVVECGPPPISAPTGTDVVVKKDGSLLKMKSGKLCFAVRKSVNNQVGAEVRLQECTKAKDFSMNWNIGIGVYKQTR